MIPSKPLTRASERDYVQSMNTTTSPQSLSATMTKIDKVVRESHEEREGHAAEGYWTERTENAGKMMPRRFVPTCCGKR